MKKQNLTSAFLLTLFAGLAGAASCKVDKSGLTFDDDAYDQLKNGGDGDNGSGGENGDGDGDMGGDGSGGNALGGMGGDGGGNGPEPGDTRCDDKQVEFFAGGDLWVPLGAECEFLCMDGECGGNCVPDSTECLSELEGRTCDEAGNWVTTECEFACVDDACGGECVPGNRQCNGNQKEICSEVGAWTSDGDPCPGTCEDSGDGVSASCTGSCNSEGETQCTGVKTWEQCVSNEWVAQDPCDFVCLDGVCGGSCQPNTSTCNANNERVSCSSQGEPGVPVHCDGQTCVAGKCEGSCEPGQEICAQGNIFVCDEGKWALDLDCGTLGDELGLSLSCRPAGPTGKQQLVCGECPYGDGETPIRRCHTTVDHGTASEFCELVEEKRVTHWTVEKDNCAACFQGSCDVTPEELCSTSNTPRGCFDVENSWFCQEGKAFDKLCTEDGSGNRQYCELASCATVPKPTH